MGKIKHSEKNGKTHTLTEREWGYLKLLNLFLNYNTEKQRLMSAFLYYVCTNRFGYAETDNLIFEADLDKDNRELTVREIPNEEIKKVLDKK